MSVSYQLLHLVKITKYSSTQYAWCRCLIFQNQIDLSICRPVLFCQKCKISTTPPPKETKQWSVIYTTKKILCRDERPRKLTDAIYIQSTFKSRFLSCETRESGDSTWTSTWLLFVLTSGVASDGLKLHYTDLRVVFTHSPRSVFSVHFFLVILTYLQLRTKLRLRMLRRFRRQKSVSQFEARRG